MHENEVQNQIIREERAKRGLPPLTQQRANEALSRSDEPITARRANDDGEPAYTVLGVYYEGDDLHQRYATVVYTHNGPEAAEELAQAVCRADNDAEDGEDLIEIAGVLRGELEVVA